ncbi:UMP-CMP kinase 2, mitochondrial isoform X2 [Spea bombifrons]|uniref:UMP-CMP kinase 2, mitochondrial isoform X2 n=1 Tax=Spea bombifrons TaxID=233779 RepID=UPI0023495EC2|nr:UMP-CMP kinase 2, mitochondrial isoform X2 [Spea bombifrons]
MFLSLVQSWSSHRTFSLLVYKWRARFKSSLMMASCLSQDTSAWEARVYAVDAGSTEGYTHPFYFTCQGSSLSSVSPSGWPALSQGGCAHSVSITTPHRISAVKLHKTLGQQMTQQLEGNCHVLRLFSYLPNDPFGSLERGFFVVHTKPCPSIESMLETLLKEYKEQVRFCSYRAGPGGEIWQNMRNFDGEGKETETCQVVRVEAPTPCPLVANIKRSAVFYNLEDACAVLQECSAFIPDASHILNLLEEKNKIIHTKGGFPVIVIEGLDATGKSTLTESLKDSMNATLLKSPPDCISQWRKIFDHEPSLLRRAYYAVGNYIGAAEIAEASQRSPVIVDRYWHSTAAYAIATEIGGGVYNLPARHDAIYQWPEDLLKPDLVILLTVSDVERILRLRKRGLAETLEEKELAVNSMFRQKNIVLLLHEEPI